VERSPDHPALVEAGGTWTYGQLAAAISKAKTWLLGSGVCPGDRVMIAGENCRAFVAVLLAVADLDAWPVLVNAHLSAREVDEIRGYCGASRVVYTTSISPAAMEHAKRDGAAIGDVADLGSIGIGPLNDRVEPEPVGTDRANSVGA
jgi:long-chain acyl-CoA synthetase